MQYKDEGKKKIKEAISFIWIIRYKRQYMVSSGLTEHNFYALSGFRPPPQLSVSCAFIE